MASEVKTEKPKEEYINVILVTHNARMRCFLEDFFKEGIDQFRKIARDAREAMGKEEDTQKKDIEIRFNNGATLLLTIEPNNGPNNGPNNVKYTLELIYDGGKVKNPKKGAYFTSPQTIQPAPISETVYIPFHNINTTGHLDLISRRNYKIYIIRHGHAQHNKKFSIHMANDTLLTNKGIEQAKLVGTVLNNIPSFKIDYLFASKLKRTRQTLKYIIFGLNDNLKSQIKNKQIIILPCSHELGYTINGKCDNLRKSSTLFPRENENVCFDDNTYILKHDEFFCSNLLDDGDEILKELKKLYIKQLNYINKNKKKFTSIEYDIIDINQEISINVLHALLILHQIKSQKEKENDPIEKEKEKELEDLIKQSEYLKLKLQQSTNVTIGNAIDWKLYKKFIKDKTNCITTNMIQLLVNYIEESAPPTPTTTTPTPTTTTPTPTPTTPTPTTRSSSNPSSSHTPLSRSRSSSHPSSSNPSSYHTPLSRSRSSSNTFGGYNYYKKYLKYKYKYLEAKNRLKFDK
jgi:hypothetical protein